MENNTQPEEANLVAQTAETTELNNLNDTEAVSEKTVTESDENIQETEISTTETNSGLQDTNNLKAKPKSANGFTPKHVMIGIGMAVFSLLLVIGGILIGTNISNSTNNNTSTSESNTSTPATTTDSNATSSDQNSTSTDSNSTSTQPAVVLTISKPTKAEIVTGQIEVTGNATASLQELTIQVFDNASQLLGSTTTSLASGDPNPIHNFTALVEITKSPKTSTGVVWVYPKNEGATSANTRMVDVTFKVLEKADRLKVFAPLEGQVISEDGGVVAFRGQMKDFFEAAVGLRLKNAMGGYLYNENINASSDNYGKWAYFEKVVTVDAMPSTSGGAVAWELYEESMLDGTVTVLISIPVVTK